jgi:fatty acid-binding protein DegV
MPSTAVVADTTSYLPAELIQRHDIHLISLYVGIEGEQDRESDLTDLGAFYERLRASDQTHPADRTRRRKRSAAGVPAVAGRA